MLLSILTTLTIRCIDCSMLVRVRLRFQSTPLNYAQKCWFTFDTENCRLVGDVAHLITTHFGFDYHNGIQLFMEDFLVPTNEAAGVFRDNDLIEVRAVRISSECADSTSSSSESSSSPEVQPPPGKRVRSNKKPVNSHSQAIPTRPETTAVNRPQSPPPAVGTTKKLHVTKKKTVSGGVHLTFRSSSSSDSESNSSEDNSSRETVTNPPPLKPIPTPTPKTKPEDPSSRNVNKAARRGRGKGRGKKQRGRTLPSSLVIGGPSDVHTTLSTVYTNKGPPANEETPAVTDNREPSAETDKNATTGKVSGESAQPASGWDVRPSEETPTVSEPARDYSTCPRLEGAPRVGDHIAFKLLELSGSCTPEVSQYKLASVLAYDHTSRRVTVKYKGPASSAADSDAATSQLAQFALEQDSMMVEACPEVELELDSLIDPKLVT